MVLGETRCLEGLLEPSGIWFDGLGRDTILQDNIISVTFAGGKFDAFGPTGPDGKTSRQLFQSYIASGAMLRIFPVRFVVAMTAKDTFSCTSIGFLFGP
jgi:hypothetical protein